MLNPALYLRRLLRRLRAHPRHRHPVLPDLPALGHPRVEPLRHARSGRRPARSSANSRLVKQGRVPPRDPPAGLGRRRARALLPAGDRARARAGRRSGTTSRWAYLPLLPVALFALLLLRRRARDPARQHQRVPPRHRALRRARAARLVLDDADRLPVRRPSPTKLGDHELAVPAEPDHRHRAHVPARDLRPGHGRQDDRRRHDASRRSSRRASTSGGTCGTSASCSLASAVLFVLALVVFGRAEGNFAEEL